MTREELILKAKAAKSAEELLALTKEYGIELTEEDAKKYFDQLHKQSEISDDELEDVTGGGCHTTSGDLLVGMGHECDSWICSYCGRPFDGDHHHRCPVKDDHIECECQHCKYAQGMVEGPKSLFFYGCFHPDKVK